MSNFSPSRFVLPNAGIVVPRAGSDLTQDAFVGQMIENLDTYGFRLNGSNAIAIGSDATGDIWYRNAGGLFTRLGIGSTGQPLVVSGGLPAWGGLTVIGPTFAAGNTTMTNIDTWYTGATLVSALLASRSYLLKGTIFINASVNDLVSARLYDSTNSVEIVSSSEVAGSTGAGKVSFSYCIEYSGYSGTPTIVIQAYDHTATSSVITSTAQGGAANKAVFVSALQIG